MTRVYDEILDQIALSTGPQDIVSFHPSEAANERVGELIRKEKEASLTADETAELDEYLRLEHIMRMVKARARLHLSRRGDE
jgi:hypothetical protein